MARMRKDQGGAAPAPGGDGGGIDTLILLDRSVDVVTPMCTQLTYEGLLDEILGLNYGQIRSSSASVEQSKNTTAAVTSSPPAAAAATTASQKKVSGLNSADPVFHETRDLFYLGARKWLNETLRSIQQFRDAGMAGADISQLKGFVAELRDKFARIPLHTALVEQLGGALRAPSFSNRQRIEAALLDEQEDLMDIEDLIYQGEGILPVLRLLCLYCAVHGGIPKRQWDSLRRDLVNTYGHKHLSTLHALHKAGLLQRREGRRSGFPAVKPLLQLLMQEGAVVDESDPADIYFTYAGYAPLSVRLVQHALMKKGGSSSNSSSSSSGGWGGIEAALAALPGPTFEVLQTVDEKGLPIEKNESGGGGGGVIGGGGGVANEVLLVGTGGVLQKKRRTVMVVFIGGVTHAEISALRFLSRKGMVDCDFIIGTNKIINGSSLLRPLLPPGDDNKK